MQQVTVRQDDEFVVRVGSDRRARVVVGPPGCEATRLDVRRFAGRPFAESRLWVLPPAEAQALLDEACGGGSAEDDAP